MSAIQKTTEEEVDDFTKNLKELLTNMRVFSLSMRSLYAVKAVGTSTDVARKFRKLRDDTRQDAILYLKCLLPISTDFVSFIKEYFEYYEALTYEEWCEMLPDILEETKAYKEVAQKLTEMHEELMISLKEREDEAKLIMTEFKNLQSEFEKQKAKLVAAANIKMLGAIALFFVPGVNFIACPLLSSFAREDSAKAIAVGSQSEVNGAAALVVANTMIPALSSFIDGLNKAAEFFEVMERELKSFEGKAERSIESPKALHYIMMSKKAAEVKSLCRAFHAALPDVRTDFAAIPREGTDQNYVDKWLEKQLAEIKENRSIKVPEFILHVFNRCLAQGEDKAEGKEKPKGEEKAE